MSAAAEPELLVLAGHDSSGGAGIDADLEAAQRFGVAARCVVTAWTKQDAAGVRSLGARDPREWSEEARHLFEHPPAFVKTGLLPGPDHVRAAAELLRSWGWGEPSAPSSRGAALVVDPVLCASSGREFLSAEGIEALVAELLPLGVVLTPNLPEAARLTGRVAADLERAEARVDAAYELLERGAAAVLLKGGHGSEDPVSDLVARRAAAAHWHTHARVAGAGLHGSGCRYATAVAAQLAHGVGLAQAAAEAGRWLAERIAGGEC